MQKKMWITDLDGTLLNNNEQLPSSLYDAINKIPSHTIKVIATGRNLEKVRRAITNIQLFDFIIFSSGAGIYDTSKQSLIHVNNLSKHTCRIVFDFLDRQKYNFIYTQKVPFNQNLYYKENYPCKHFDQYLYAHERDLDRNLTTLNNELAQFMVFIPNNEDLIQSITTQIHSISDELQVIRATSPIDASFCWIEIFHREVSKGKAVRFLSHTLSIDLEHSIGVGNDYNDLDFLTIIGNPYVVENSPSDLKNRFNVVASNQDHGVLDVLKKHGIA
ncbi:Cof-type HAD-IIB family hydrolase [Halosquirtibacter xylanolyticus]|uniref:HAD family hydrolase n=1 Tax=Halosquirtibacter xylanolyticus TaxID=3374599 RepID=UPI003748470B|nr:Cof-type HAD-IIB family hydrolase [Prolixibacteraceae bacterium]